MKDTSVFVLLRLPKEPRIQETSVNKEEHRSALLCSFIDAGDVVRQKYKTTLILIIDIAEAHLCHQRGSVHIIIYLITSFLCSVGAQAQAEELRSSSFTLGEA